MRINLTKSMHTATAALFIALFTLPTAAKAQSEELLEIGDIKVTADNCNDLSVIKGVSGTVKYDPATKVLTLQNAMIDIEEGHGIYSEVKGLAIRLIGVNNLKAKKAAIGFREALVITGGGTLNADRLQHHATGWRRIQCSETLRDEQRRDGEKQGGDNQGSDRNTDSNQHRHCTARCVLHRRTTLVKRLEPSSERHLYSKRQEDGEAVDAHKWL